jgi:hypothetical protein
MRMICRSGEKDRMAREVIAVCAFGEREHD